MRGDGTTKILHIDGRNGKLPKCQNTGNADGIKSQQWAGKGLGVQNDRGNGSRMRQNLLPLL